MKISDFLLKIPMFKREENERKRKRKIAIVLIIALLAIIMMIAIFSTQRKTPDSIPDITPPEVTTEQPTTEESTTEESTTEESTTEESTTEESTTEESTTEESTTEESTTEESTTEESTTEESTTEESTTEESTTKEPETEQQTTEESEAEESETEEPTTSIPEPEARYGITLSQTGTYVFTAQAEGYSQVVAHTVTVTNSGNQPTGDLTVTLSGTNSNRYMLSKSTITTIEVGNSNTFTIRPNTGLTKGTYTATVTVEGSNGISASFNVTFTVNEKLVEPRYGITLSQTGTFTFAGQTEGYTQVVAHTVTVTNSGNQPTGALRVIISGTNSNRYTLSKSTITTIAVGNSSTFTIRPNTGLIKGTYTATVTVEGENGIKASFNVTFTVSEGSTEPPGTTNPPGRQEPTLPDDDPEEGDPGIKVPEDQEELTGEPEKQEPTLPPDDSGDPDNPGITVPGNSEQLPDSSGKQEPSLPSDDPGESGDPGIVVPSGIPMDFSEIIPTTESDERTMPTLPSDESDNVGISVPGNG